MERKIIGHVLGIPIVEDPNLEPPEVVIGGVRLITCLACKWEGMGFPHDEWCERKEEE